MSKAIDRVYFVGTETLTWPDAGILVNLSHSGETVVLCAPSRPPTQTASSSREKVRIVVPGAVVGLAEVGEGVGVGEVALGSGVARDGVGEVGADDDADGLPPVEHAASTSAVAATTRTCRLRIAVPSPERRTDPGSLTRGAESRAPRRADG